MTNVQTLPARAIPPMGLSKAAQQVKVLVGSYPREPHDAPTYVAAMTQVIAEYPESVGREAIDRLTRRCKFAPTRAEMLEVLEEVKLESRPKQDRQTHIEEMAELRRRQAEKDAVLRADRERLEATLGASSPDWWSIPVMRRYAGGSAAQFRNSWFKTEGDTAARERLLATWGAGDAA